MESVKTTVYCVLKEEMGGYPVEELYASLSEDDAQRYQDEYEPREDEGVWIQEVEFSSVKEAEQALRNLPVYS
jgi:hypothetical protein